MNFSFRSKRIAGILTIVPANERSFVEDMKNFNFPEARSLKLKQVMGFDKHRVVMPGVCVSDLAVAGLEHLFKNGLLDRDGFDALILVTQSPDHFMPPTSNIIQGRLNLKHDLLCMDINQGCAGFVIGLIQAFMLLEQESVRRVVLINADVLSRKTSPKDRNSYPLVGDAASITIVERDPEDSVIHTSLKMDGTRNEALMIPAGGLRLPSSPETAVLEDVGDNNLRAKDHLRMDGSAVFNFVQIEVPELIENLLAAASVPLEKVDYVLSHQANRFMLEKLADKLKLPRAKMPSNVVEHFGNSSGVTIPMVITFNLAEHLRQNRSQVILASYGVGLTWSAMLLQLGGLKFCEMIEYP
ncbi:MAG: ketoacyl-ACP synthase III [Verrucomicrobiales bacterium]|nr:ketoacyl-ACP synthase III [Verrucomicrobiales bacterium]